MHPCSRSRRRRRCLFNSPRRGRVVRRQTNLQSRIYIAATRKVLEGLKYPPRKKKNVCLLYLTLVFPKFLTQLEIILFRCVRYTMFFFFFNKKKRILIDTSYFRQQLRFQLVRRHVNAAYRVCVRLKVWLEQVKNRYTCTVQQRFGDLSISSMGKILQKIYNLSPLQF